MNIKQQTVDGIINALHENFTSTSEVTRYLDAANVVDGMFVLARAISKLADAIKEQKDTAIPPS